MKGNLSEASMRLGGGTIYSTMDRYSTDDIVPLVKRSGSVELQNGTREMIVKAIIRELLKLSVIQAR